MKRIQVLLSSYNGAKYIQQQLNSIFYQNDLDIFCLVRDDGSTDNTCDILLECQKKYENLEIIIGDNIGYESSFMELVRLSGDYDYYAFSDQDDVWEPGKLKRAIEKISQSDHSKPTMYCSNCTIVDESLNVIGMLHPSKKNITPTSKINSLIEGFAHGCTIVFNKKSIDFILSHNPMQDYSHDFWIPLLHVFFGNIIYDNNSYILYRQHSENIFGEKRSLVDLIKLKLKFLENRKNFYSLMAKDILIGYNKYLSKQDYKLLNDISEYRSSLSKQIKLLFNKDIKRNTIRGTIVLKLLILFSKF